MTGPERDIKVVEWSGEDRAFVGLCPGVIGPCCHGSDEVEVYRELCEIVAEWVEIVERDGTPLPPATAGTGGASDIDTDDVAGGRGHTPPALAEESRA